MELTISEVNAWLRCRWMADKSITARGNLQKKGGVAALKFGDIFHQALEVKLQGGDHHEFLREEIAALPTPITDEKMAEYVEAAPAMMRAVDVWAEEFFRNYRIIQTEHRGFIRINDKTPGDFFGYKFDVLMQDRRGKYWLLDWKTTSRRPSNGDYLIFDPQAVGYQMAAEEDLGIKIEGAHYVFIYKKVPTVPMITQKGKVSKQSVVTTDEIWEQAMIKNRIPYTQGDLDRVKYAMVDNYIREFQVVATLKQRSLFREELQTIVADILNPDAPIYRSPDEKNCNMCSFRDICEASRLGLPIDQMLEMGYEQRQPRD